MGAPSDGLDPPPRPAMTIAAPAPSVSERFSLTALSPPPWIPSPRQPAAGATVAMARTRLASDHLSDQAAGDRLGDGGAAVVVHRRHVSGAGKPPVDDRVVLAGKAAAGEVSGQYRRANAVGGEVARR